MAVDTRENVTASIIQVFINKEMAVPDAIIGEIKSILSHYNLVKIEPVVNDTTTRITHFHSAKRVDGLSARTIKAYEQQLNAFNKFVDRSPDIIKTDDIRDYLAYLYNRGLRDTSISTIINTLKSFFAWLYTEEIIKKNPMLKIKPIRIDKKRLRTALTLEEVEKIREYCISIRDKAMFELFYSSGCRLSELVGLNISDIDLHERSISVKGKGNKQRITFFPVKAKMCLQEYLRTRKGNNEALFLSSIKPYNRLQTRAIQRRINWLGEASGVGKVYPHILRHTFAVHALNCGMDITVIQQLMGHEDINTTQIYAKISNSVIRQEYSKLTF